jgi:hypothetical protein
MIYCQDSDTDTTEHITLRVSNGAAGFAASSPRATYMRYLNNFQLYPQEHNRNL